MPCRFCVLLALAISSVAQSAPPAHAPDAHSLTVLVLDENGVAVPAARVQLQGSKSLKCETDLTGHCKLDDLGSAPWHIRVDKEGFYASDVPGVQDSGTLEVDVHHQEEVRENVNVVESIPAIDPAQVSSQEQLSGINILEIPYPNTRDYRYALNYIPGVILDQSGQPHVNGAETYETLVLLDGFNVTQPANGQLLVRPSTDALRQVTVESSRVSAEYGKGPAGVLSIETGIGDDHFRYAVT
ncbi:MAG TPA: TonB-dependent receptor, partial [Terriglobales bacterium]|nr:TonB-dependent receptor [Terriglobales bacterium]